MGVKISISLPTEDVEYLDAYAAKHGSMSRSAAVHRAVRALRQRSLASQYEAAMDEWLDGADAKSWDGVVGDGLVGEAQRREGRATGATR